MSINMIVAHDVNRAIGRGNTLPWHIKEDLQFFSKMTRNKVVVMGENTYRSIGRLLPSRTSVILSLDTELKVEGATVVHDIKDVIPLGEHMDVFIIGGGQIYKAFLPYTENLYITQIDLNLEDADTHFPPYEEEFECLIDGKEHYSEHQDCLFSFNLWKRKKNKLA